MLAKAVGDHAGAQKLIDEFLDGYYGPAAGPIREYLKLTHDAVAASGDALGCFSPADAKFLSLPMLSAGLRLLGQAETAASEDVALRQRVQVAELPLLYALLVRWETLRKDAEAGAAPWPVDDSIRAVFERSCRSRRPSTSRWSRKAGHSSGCVAWSSRWRGSRRHSRESGGPEAGRLPWCRRGRMVRRRVLTSRGRLRMTREMGVAQ